jgi:hypothetical protein
MLVIKNIQGTIRYAMEEDPSDSDNVGPKRDAVPLPIIKPNRNLKTFETWYNENYELLDEIMSYYFAIILQYTQETSYRYAFDEHVFRNLLARVIYKTSDSRYKTFV